MWPHDDRQLREVDRDLVDVGDRAPGLRRPQRARVADLRAERHAELDAGREQRVVAAVGRRRLPQPRDHAQALEAELGRRSGAARAPPPSAGPGRPRPGRRSGRGAPATQPATSSLEISGPPGPCHALSSPKPTPPRSIAASVTSIGGGSSGIASPVQRRSESNISWRRSAASGAASTRRRSSAIA